MAVWYCNYGNGTNTGYYAVAQWAALTVYGAGAIVRQLATPARGSERCFRTTAGGTSGAAEPTWTLTKGGTTAGDGSVTWVEVTGNSTYNWSAPHARWVNATNSGWISAGDTVYIASAHNEVFNNDMANSDVGTAAAPVYVICVNAAGSVPPVAADVTTGAVISQTTTGGINIQGVMYHVGVTFDNQKTGAYLTYCNTSYNLQVFKNCSLKVANSSTFGPGQPDASIVLDNTPVTLGGTSSHFYPKGHFLWKNTASALPGTNPTTVIQPQAPVTLTMEGVDLSALGSGKTIVSMTTYPGSVSLNNCELGASVTVAATPTSPNGVIQLQISDSANTQYRQESYQYQGTLTTETTFVRSGGASDGTTPISWKVVTTANAHYSSPFATFQIAQWVNTTGSAKTATIEIENGGTTLTNAQVWMELEYLGSSSFPLASFVSSGAATILTTGTNIPTSSVTWNGGLGSAVKQYLQVSFTPQTKGYVRATVYVAAASTTLYIDPVLTIA